MWWCWPTLTDQCACPLIHGLHDALWSTLAGGVTDGLACHLLYDMLLSTNLDLCLTMLAFQPQLQVPLIVATFADSPAPMLLYHVVGVGGLLEVVGVGCRCTAGDSLVHI